MPAGSFSLALTTFVSQNIGANKPERIKKGARFGIIAGMLISETAGVFIYIFAPYLIRLFDGDSEVIKFGVAQARNIVFAYFLVSFSHCMARRATRSGACQKYLCLQWYFSGALSELYGLH